MKKSDRKQQRRDRRQQNTSGRSANIIKGVMRRLNGLPKRETWRNFIGFDPARPGSDKFSIIQVDQAGHEHIIHTSKVYSVTIKSPTSPSQISTA